MAGRATLFRRYQDIGGQLTRWRSDVTLPATDHTGMPGVTEMRVRHPAIDQHRRYDLRHRKGAAAARLHFMAVGAAGIICARAGIGLLCPLVRIFGEENGALQFFRAAKLSQQLPDLTGCELVDPRVARHSLTAREFAILGGQRAQKSPHQLRITVRQVKRGRLHIELQRVALLTVGLETHPPHEAAAWLGLVAVGAIQFRPSFRRRNIGSPQMPLMIEPQYVRLPKIFPVQLEWRMTLAKRGENRSVPIRGARKF